MKERNGLDGWKELKSVSLSVCLSLQVFFVSCLYTCHFLSLESVRLPASFFVFISYRLPAFLSFYLSSVCISVSLFLFAYPWLSVPEGVETE